MSHTPPFRKPDRYKASSYRSYNTVMPERYDRIWGRWLGPWDRAIAGVIGSDIAALRILDVGCATGRLLQVLASAGATALAGADLAPRILDVAAQKLAQADVHADLQPADAEDRLPWDDSTFDAVTLTGVLHHFFRPMDALAEIRRVLRPGGRLLVADPSFFTPLRQVLNTWFRFRPHDGDYHFYSATGAAKLLVSAGFRITRAERIPFGYLLDASKPVMA